MPRPILLSIVLFLLLNTAGTFLGAQSIQGEGPVVKKTITLDPIHAFDLSIAADVILTQGNTQKIEIEAQENIIDNLNREVKNGSWRISFNDKVKNANKVTIYMTVKSADKISLSGSGKITTTNRFTGIDDLMISVSGSGEIHMEAEADDTQLSISGSGDVDLIGKTGDFNIAISGSGDVDAKGFQSDDCNIHISGSGDASVAVNGDLNAMVSGSGDIRYSGNASVTSKVSGSGTISKI